MGFACRAGVGAVGQRKALRLALATMSIVTLLGSVPPGDARAETAGMAAEGFTAEEVAEAAHVMDVPDARAAEDLTAQHEGHALITELIESGDQVWFDNATTTIHAYGTATPRTTPPGLADHLVYDSAPRPQANAVSSGTATSCGPIGEEDEYCSPLYAGVRIFHTSGAIQGYCTAGWMVRDYSGNPYMLTAGHCADWGTTFYSNPVTTYTWPKLTACEPGPWIAGESPWAGHDAAIYPVTGCKGVKPYIKDFGTGKKYHQEGATNTQYVGEYVCHYGVTSLHQCGTQLEVDVPYAITYTNIGATYTIQETDIACGTAEPGDSGSAAASGVYKGDATGIVIAAGTDARCPYGKTWDEQRIFTVLGLFNVYVASE